MKDLFDTEEKKKLATSHFMSLLEHPGWKLVEKIAHQNIEILIEQILAGGKSKEEVDKLRQRLTAYKDVMNTPTNMIKQFIAKDDSEPSDDPYQTKEELLKERKKR